MKISTKIVIVIIIQTLALLAMIAVRQWTLETGAQIMLETAPIDPRSLFSGDYVSLGYKISEVPAPKEFMDKLKINETVYVVLVPKGPYWVAESIQSEKPDVTLPKVAIKGTVNFKDANKVYLKYGIEDYFIPEGEGKKLERPKKDENITVKVAVDKFGNAAISGLYINDKEIYQEKLF